MTSGGGSVNVQDRPAEVGIKLNNVLTAILIAAVGWVGVNIQTMSRDIGEMKTVQAVERTVVAHLEEKVDRHINDKQVHMAGHTHASE